MFRQILRSRLKSRVISITLALFHIQVINPVIINKFSLWATSDQTCSAYLDKAEDSFYEGKLDEAVALVMQCLNENPTEKSLQTRAYTILIRTYLAKDNPGKAREMIEKMLEINPDYQPTIEEEMPQYVNLVTEVREERTKIEPKEEETGMNWVLIGTGGVATVAILALLLSGGGDEPAAADNSLPGPPDFPR